MGRILDKVKDISVDQRINLINQWVFSERNRNISKRKLVDDISYERIAEEYELTPNTVKSIVKSAICVMCDKNI